MTTGNNKNLFFEITTSRNLSQIQSEELFLMDHFILGTKNNKSEKDFLLLSFYYWIF